MGTTWLKCFHLHVVPDAVRTKWCGPGMQSWGGRAGHTEGVSLTMGHSHSLRRLAYISQSLSLTTEEIKAISLALSQDCITGLWALQGRGLLKFFTLWTLSPSVCSFQIERKPWLFDQHVLKLANIGSITVIFKNPLPSILVSFLRQLFFLLGKWKSWRPAYSRHGKPRE